MHKVTEQIPTLAQWLYEEWGYLHPDHTYMDVKRLIEQRTNLNTISMALVAFKNKELVGTVCLKVHDMDTRSDLSPWLAGLYVSTTWRKKGIGAKLVSAIEQKASTLNLRFQDRFKQVSQVSFHFLVYHAKAQPLQVATSPESQ